jgi:hypothetical protein
MMLSIYKEQSQKYTLPQVIMNMVPINMRPYVEPPVQEYDAVCGSSALLWLQELNAEDLLWDVVSVASENIIQQIEEGSGLKWWRSVNASEPQITPTFMASSIGIIPVESRYSAIKIKGIKIKGGAYGAGTAENSGIMLHLYTVNEKMNFTFSYTKPPITTEWAEKFAHNIQEVLRILSESTYNLTCKEMLERLL